MNNTSDIRLLKLEGTPRERGRARGEEIKGLIWEQLERLKYGFPSAMPYPGINPDTLADRFIEETGHIATAEKVAPHLLEEVRGIGEGSGIGFNQAFMLSAVDELGWHAASLGGLKCQCSTLGCWREDDTPAMMGQNLDQTIHFRGIFVVTHITEPDGRQKLMVCTAGGLGFMGLSSTPLGICVNAVGLMSSRTGLPLQFMARSIIDQADLDDAVSFLKSNQVGGAQNIMIGDSERVVDYEASANAVVQWKPSDDARRVYHTNHHLANDDIIPGFPGIRQDSIDRLNYLKYRLDDPAKPVYFENMKGILRSHLGPICIHGEFVPRGAPFTVASVIYVLSEEPELHVVLGNPCESEYQKFCFD